MPPKRSAAEAKEPAAKRAKAEAKAKAKGKAKAKAAAPRASDADLDNELNTMIQSAKDGEFEKVFEILDKYPPYVNERPEERMYSTIHQACYWGNLDAIKKLVNDYEADINATTKDGKTPVEVAKEHEHTAIVKYFEGLLKKKSAAATPPVAGGRNKTAERERITVTRNDGANDDPDMDLSGVKQVTLKLGADGGGILCGAALVYSGVKKEKAVCISDRKFKTAITHSGDTTEPSGRRTHTIKIDLTKMPAKSNKIYLTLCSCGPANLQKFTRPSIELLGDDEPMLRYDLKDAGKSQSTIMAVLDKDSGEWIASPVGAISSVKFCGNYKAAEKLISEDSAGSSGGGGGGGGEDGDLSLAGKTLVFTGTLTMPRKEAKSKAEAAGAKVTAAVSGATNVVVAGPGAGEKLEIAKGYGCEIWSEEQFKECVE